MAGLFDGIDIDWEFPGACGNTCAFSPADPRKFKLLLAEFRRTARSSRQTLPADDSGAGGSHRLLSARTQPIHPCLNYIN